MIVIKIEVSEICWMHSISWIIKEFAQLNKLLYNHCIGTDFKKKKFARIINPEEDKLNIWNQRQLHHHQGETQSKTHHCIFMRIVPYKLHCICLFAYHYHMRVSFLDTLGSLLHEPQHASRSLLSASKNYIMYSLEAHK